MNGQINQLVKSLLQKDSLEHCSLEELQTFADRHPYFGAAQLLLTKKLKTENSAQYNDQLQKTFLFFHNPLWVEQLLSDTGQAEIIPAKKTAVPEIVEAKEEPAVVLTESIVSDSEPILKKEETITPNQDEEKTVPISEEANDVVSLAEQNTEELEMKIPQLHVGLLFFIVLATSLVMISSAFVREKQKEESH